jgi:hypothetical protein
MGHGAPGAAFGVTQDVAAILPAVEMVRIEAGRQCRDAFETAHKELEPTGLCIPPLFADEQVVRTTDWLQRMVAIQPNIPFRHLKLFRPAGDRSASFAGCSLPARAEKITPRALRCAAEPEAKRAQSRPEFRRAASRTNFFHGDFPSGKLGRR